MTHVPPVDPVRKFAGGAMVAVGGLIAVACAAGTLAAIGGFFYTVIRSPESVGAWMTIMLGGSLLVAILGLTPMVAGILLARWGRRMMLPQAGESIPPEDAP